LRRRNDRRHGPALGLRSRPEGRFRSRRTRPARRATGRRPLSRAALRPRPSRVCTSSQDASTHAASSARRARCPRPYECGRRPGRPRRVARDRRLGRVGERRDDAVSTAHVERVRATAFAKLTLSLRVLGPPRADGFHDVEALTVPIGQPHDALEAVAAPDQPGVTLDVVAGDDGVPTGRENLAVRAAESLLARSRRGGRRGRRAPRERLPPPPRAPGGAGDAAASLLAVHQLLEANVPDAELFALAADLGSDVPFFLAGGAAWMRGRGDVLERVALRPGLPMLVVMPPFPLATVDVYRAWDDLAGPRSPRSVPSPEPIAGLVPELVNDLQ